MKQTLLESRMVYENPLVTEVDLASEGRLCLSGSGVVDKFEWVEDADGWDKF